MNNPSQEYDDDTDDRLTQYTNGSGEDISDEDKPKYRPTTPRNRKAYNAREWLEEDEDELEDHDEGNDEDEGEETWGEWKRNYLMCAVAAEAELCLAWNIRYRYIKEVPTYPKLLTDLQDWLREVPGEIYNNKTINEHIAKLQLQVLPKTRRSEVGGKNWDAIGGTGGLFDPTDFTDMRNQLRSWIRGQPGTRWENSGKCVEAFAKEVVGEAMGDWVKDYDGKEFATSGRDSLLSSPKSPPRRRKKAKTRQ